MNISGSVALVTGANRGIGRHFAQQLLRARRDQGLRRPPATPPIDLPGVEVLRLDITDPASVAAAAAAAARRHPADQQRRRLDRHKPGHR